MIFPVLDKRVFEFSYLGNSATQDIVIQSAIPVYDFYRVRLIVRVHSITATSGNFVFKLQHTLPSEQDPQEFTNTTDFLTTSSITDASPNIKTVTGTDPQAFLKLVLRATQGTSGNTLYGEFSAVMVLGVN